VEVIDRLKLFKLITLILDYTDLIVKELIRQSMHWGHIS